jgi:hypothetical protein
MPKWDESLGYSQAPLWGGQVWSVATGASAWPRNWSFLCLQALRGAILLKGVGRDGVPELEAGEAPAAI